MNNLSYSQIQRQYREHKKNNPSHAAGDIKVALLGDFTLEPFAAYLHYAAIAMDMPINIYIGSFNQYAQEMIDRNSSMHVFSPDAALLIFSPLNTQSRFELPGAIESLIEAFRRESDATLFISNLIAPVSPYRFSPNTEAIEIKKANDLLETAASKFSSVYIMDFDSLASYFGKEKVSNMKLHYMGGIDFGPEFMETAACNCVSRIRLLRHAPKKMLVLDLDNTLWGGIVGESGADGISLSRSGPGAEYADFQIEILKLARRGTLLAINSKNNYDDAMKALTENPNMILRPEHFSSIRVNWRDKASNMEEIAGELNIGLDSFVFLDDSPVERGMIRTLLPEIYVPDLPEDSSLYASFLRNLDCFESLSSSDEDKNRAAMYSEQKQRESARSGFDTIESYLKSLNITAIVFPIGENSLSRAAQLVVKTNQFNLTTIRHTQSEIQRMIESPDYEVIGVRVKDSYGDYGITGLVILKYDGRVCDIDTFLLSCRILGRRIEETVMSAIARLASNRAEKIVGKYIPTKKNSQVSNLYDRFNFTRVSETDGVVVWEIDANCATKNIRQCELHTLIAEELDL